MYLRAYQPSDCKALTELFYQTVHTVNAKHYTKAQLDAWATGQPDLAAWHQALERSYTVVAMQNGGIAGFGNITDAGLLDRLFVHANHQGQGIGTAICDLLEQRVQGTITTHASLTARPFFEKRGYVVIKAQQVERRGVFLPNFVMEKKR